MRRAIALSAAGLGGTSPNPPVGCVILTPTGQVAGQGYHERKGRPHAEANALAAARERAAGGTAVVTLEPCNHQGRTPPCHQALIGAGVARVLVAVLDPTSRGAGGVARLRQAGLEVETGVLEAEARLVLGPWLTALTTHRPQLTWPYVVGPDGSSAGLAAIPHAAALRAVADVVLRADGSVEEAVPGRHDPQVLALGSAAPAGHPEAMTEALYGLGARLVLLDANPASAAAFLAAGLIDRVVACVPLPEASSAQAPCSAGILPAGFALTCASHDGRYLRLEGHRLA